MDTYHSQIADHRASHNKKDFLSQHDVCAGEQDDQRDYRSTHLIQQWSTNKQISLKERLRLIVQPRDRGPQSQPFFPPYDDVDSFLVLASKWIRWFEAARSRQEHQKISVGTTAGHRGKYLYEDRRHSQYQISTGSLQIDNMCRYVRYHIHMQQNEHEQMFVPIVTVTTM